MSVYNSEESQIETAYGPYTISVALSPTGTLTSTSSPTLNGVASFTNIRILSAGTFNIVASSGDMSQGTSQSVTITNFVYRTTITTNAIQTVAFPFSVEVRVKGEDLQLFTGSASITLYRQENGVDTTLATDTVTSGIKIFTVTETSVGIKTYKATGNGISETVTFTVVISKLKISSVTPQVIHI